MPAALEIVGLKKAYGNVRAVDGLDLAAERGAVTAVLGPNGAGKTTTIECCEGLRRPDDGTIRVLGLDPLADGHRVRERVGVMLQDGGLPNAARAGAVLRHVAAMYAAPRDASGLIGRLGLTAAQRTPVRHLSGGQRQRLALACAVVGRPDLVFLDEPSAGLDPQARLAVWDMIRELRDEGTSVLLTTHLMAEAEALADHVAIVDHGRVIAAGSPAALTTPADDGAAAVRFTGPPGLGTALAAALPHVMVDEVSPGSYLARAAVPGPGPTDTHAVAGVIAAASAWAARSGVLLTDFGTTRRTLEDVFLDLTGRDLR